MADLSEFRQSSVPVNGRYRDDRMRTYFAYEEHWAYQIRNGDELAGFALIRKSEPGTYLLGEFFILSEFRKRGVGTAAVTQLLHKFHGNWQIPFQSNNPNAATFWQKTISSLGYSARESTELDEVLVSFKTVSN